jgi:anti-anti-sigma factor
MGNGQPPAADTAEHGIPIVQLRISGTLDAPALPQVEHAVEEVLAVNPRVLLLDLTDCAHIDAAGIDLLLQVHRRMRRNRGRLTVQAPSSQAQRLLRIACVDHVLDVRAADTEPAGAAPRPAVPTRPTRRAAVPVTTAMLQGELL